MKKAFLGLCIAVIGFAATVGAGENGRFIVASDIIGNKFLLRMVDGKEFTGMKQPFVEFGDELAISGSVCNVFRAQGMLADGILTVGPVMTSRMICPDNELSLLETRFLWLLDAGVTLSLNGDKLIMHSEGGELIFAKEGGEAGTEELPTDGGPDPVTEDALLGKKFVLTKVAGKDFSSNRQPFIAFSKENGEFRTHGEACNNFTGAAEIRDGKLIVKAAAATMMMCEDDDLRIFEQHFHRLLSDEPTITLDSGTLTLRADGYYVQYIAEENKQ